MKIQDTLLEIRMYYTFTRGVGHTALMKEGTKHYQGEKLVLVGTLDEHQNTETKLCETISLKSLDKLRGRNTPMVIDNHAIMILFEEAILEIENLDSNNKKLIQDKLHYLLTISELKNEINEMKRNPFKTFLKTIFK